MAAIMTIVSETSRRYYPCRRNPKYYSTQPVSHSGLGRCIIHLRCFRHLQEVLLNARGQSDVVSVFRLT